MLKSHLKLAFRNLLRNRWYALITIGGLAAGLAAFLVILVYVNHETGYDKWNPRLAHVYRLSVQETVGGNEKRYSGGTSVPLGIRLKESCPEIEALTQVSFVGEAPVTANGKSAYEQKIISADSSFLSVFPYAFAYGGINALNRPAQVIISSQTATRLFGAGDVIGKTIDIVIYGDKKTFTVSGVFRKTGRSHLDFDFCLSSVSRDATSWGRSIFTTYVKLRPDARLASFSSKADRVFAQGYYLRQQEFAGKKGGAGPSSADLASWMAAEKIAKLHLLTEAVSSIHLRPQATNWSGAQSPSPVNDYSPANLAPVVTFSLAGLLILVLACVNYTNLAIARAGKRSRETAIRKVLGSAKNSLVSQFLVEALVYCTMALVIALAAAKLLLAYLNGELNLNLSLWNPLQFSDNLVLTAELAGVILFTTLLAGLYPAYFLVRFRPVSAIRGAGWKGSTGKRFRNTLIVAQFVISITFITGMMVVVRQVNFMQHGDRGFQTGNVLSISVANGDLITAGRDDQRIDYIKRSLLAIPGVRSVAISNIYPGDGQPNQGEQVAKCDGDTATLRFKPVDFNYFRMFGMSIVQGRDFSPEHPLDSVDAAVLNEAAVRKMHLANPLGKTVNVLLRDYRVIGVLRDNLNDGFEQRVQPSVYFIGAQRGLLGYNNLLVNLDDRRPAGTVTAISRFWSTLEPSYPMRYTWVSDAFARMLDRPRKLGRLAIAFSVISMLLALTGVFALVSLAAGERIKEIGVRKVFGATAANIVALLSVDLLKLVLVAVFIAAPVSWWLMQRWLQDFAYRAGFAWWILPSAGVAAVGLSLLTIGVRALYAALTNPVHSLKND